MEGGTMLISDRGNPAHLETWISTVWLFRLDMPSHIGSVSWRCSFCDLLHPQRVHSSIQGRLITASWKD